MSEVVVTLDTETNEVIGVEVEDFGPFADRQGPDFKRQFQLAFEDSTEGNEAAREIFITLVLLAIPDLALALAQK